MANTSAHGKLLNAAHRALTEQQYQQAHKLAMQVLQANPQEAEAYFIMALITRQHDNIAKAEDIIRRALKFDGENVNYLLFQAQCLLELNQTDDAKAILAGLSTANIASAHQNDTVGVLHSRLGQHAAALDYFRRACELKADH
ncbi:MAG: tetratricopeptide repeat protein, partial [Halioglobus sp.]